DKNVRPTKVAGNERAVSISWRGAILSLLERTRNAPARQSALMIGARLGKWIIDKEIGRGGMGRVYLAHEDPGDRQAALKVLAAELAQETGFLERFKREIEVLDQLHHPNIVRLYDSGSQDGLFY